MSAQFDRDSENNPLMANWTFVYLPYCDGGSFTGAASGTYNGSNLSYSGLANRETTVSTLKASFNFAAATDVVVGGASAGGIAAYLHCDWYAAQVPSAHAACMPDSEFRLNIVFLRRYIPTISNIRPQKSLAALYIPLPDLTTSSSPLARWLF